MIITTLSGSPSVSSRSGALLDFVIEVLRKKGYEIRRYSATDFPAEDLILARYNSPALEEFKATVADSRALLVSTPVYKASFAGILKTVLDLLPEQALAGKVVLPLASAGSPSHVLALEYALKPVLSALGAHHVLNGVYATDKQLQRAADGDIIIDDDISIRLQHATDRLIHCISSPSDPIFSAGSVFNAGSITRNANNAVALASARI